MESTCPNCVSHAVERKNPRLTECLDCGFRASNKSFTQEADVSEFLSIFQEVS